MRTLILWIALAPFYCIAALASNFVSEPLLPPAIPLAVKSPYLNAWLPTSYNDRPGHLASGHAKFWPVAYPGSSNKAYSLPWTGLLGILDKSTDESVTYVWMGDGNDVVSTLQGRSKKRVKVHIAEQTAFTFTATRSIFEFSVPLPSSNDQALNVTATFLTPLHPKAYANHSLPFSYLNVEVSHFNISKYDVSVYADISALWSSGDAHTDVTWEYAVAAGAHRYDIQRAEPQVLREAGEQAEWGSTVWGVKAGGTRITTASGPKGLMWELFVKHGKLDGSQDVAYRNADGEEKGEPVFAFAWNVGQVQETDGKSRWRVKIGSKHDPETNQKTPSEFDNQVTFAIGHMRSPYVNYITRDGLVNFEGLALTACESTSDTTTGSLLATFLQSYDDFLAKAIALDVKVKRDATKVGGKKYAAIVELSTRQAMATFEFVKHHEDDFPWAFLKEISSNGDMSTIDVIFPLYPILMYLNPELVKMLLEPIMVYTVSGLYPNKWPVHDLGVFPSAFGHNDGADEPMPVEEAGNMLWMILAYFQATNDRSWIEKYYDTLVQWTVYLTTDGLIPAQQLSTDDFSGPLSNQTNLAVKAIVGIGAMAELSKACGRYADWVHYRATAEAYVREWLNFAMTTTFVSDPKHPNSTIPMKHAKLAYQDEGSWGTLYNLLGDKILGLNLFPKELYKEQDAWYATKKQRFGVPLDSRHLWTKTDWEIFAAATAVTGSARDMFVDLLYDYLSLRKVNAGFPDLYETTTGNFPGRDGLDFPLEFIARPVVGGHFALLACELAESSRAGRAPFEGNEGAVKISQAGDHSTQLHNGSPSSTSSQVGLRMQEPLERVMIRWD